MSPTVAVGTTSTSRTGLPRLLRRLATNAHTTMAAIDATMIGASKVTGWIIQVTIRAGPLTRTCGREASLRSSPANHAASLRRIARPVDDTHAKV